MHCKILVLFVLVSFYTSYGLEYNKQRYNPSSDLLAHEIGQAGGSAWGKKDTIVPSNPNNNDYNSQFPSLGQSQRTSVSNTPDQIKSTPNSGKRDYVATPRPATSVSHNNVPPQTPTRNLQSLGKRDYVAPQPQHSTPKPVTTVNHNNVPPQSPSQKVQTTGKRDYVAPQYTTQKPTSDNSGRVKDLINFYDNKQPQRNNPHKIPSFSSIVQGNNKQGNTGPTITSTPMTPSKPLSFSSVVSGSNKPNSPANVVTSKPSNTTPKVSEILNPTNNARPGVVLPSSLVNTVKNNNQGISSGLTTDADLQTLSEELLRKDTNNAAKYITINYQEKTSSQSKDDKAPQPLLSVASDVWNIPTVQKLVPLLDNYERDTMVNEYVTPQERNEENAFMDAIMNTAVIRHLMNFLREKGYVSPDPKQQRDYLKQLWFNLYSRGKGKISSSGFEHVFVSELKNGDIQGLHNWIYFYREEAANRLNYLGYLKYQQFGDKGSVMKLHFNQQGGDKPVDTIFIGTSPELEIALYTLCFVTRADNDCKLKLASKDVNIVTHTFRYRSKNYIGSAYPQI